MKGTIARKGNGGIDLGKDIDFSQESRIPPYSIEVEQEVLACILLEGEPIEQVIQIFGDNDEKVFYEQRHQLIYKAMLELYQKRLAIDLITVGEELSRINELTNIGGRQYLAELTNKVVSSANIEYYARLAKEKYLYRRLISISSRISSAAYSSELDVFDLVELASQQFFNISQAGLKKKASNIKELLKNATRMLENLSASQSSVTGVASGFSELDEMTAGFQQSDLIIIAARPSAGKTAFALALARNAAVDFNTPVLFFSLEMAEVQLAVRLMCAEACVESQAVRSGRITPEMMGLIINSMDDLAEAKLFIDDTPGISIMELTAKARRMKQEHNIGMIVVDYLQLVSPVRDGKSNREQEIAQISRSLKFLAKELNIAIISLAQLNRSVEQRSGDRRPQLSDLRESGSIEQDADVVMFLSRPEMYGIKNFDDGTSSKDIVEIVIGKQRNGPIGDIRLRFLKNYGKFLSTSNVYTSDNYAAPEHTGGSLEHAALPELPPPPSGPAPPDRFIAPDDAPF
ncbi:MAG: replicative DNA helicase [Prosthecochloris sp.]|uniref:Replicative DNA helicase n=1 Tax=Prosthecochloris aestuarii (strain DSM 271 / SK 413) TaxID=290512 RepID=B4S4E7_PROA2|nr:MULTISPECIES: replicative DNA helicase [Prosthecochloris]ACF45395.1 replicative DNA helicase [Prosthecochloris aestuarii DSM 271]MCW8797835.1 replicative DNA helicase [Prosthecochloris sp.]NEX12726.1 replicative DNA helicase [Prosthecochloris sp.]RDD31413.1 replicative DNA helicase [Prosthecochloris sp. ZM]